MSSGDPYAGLATRPPAASWRRWQMAAFDRPEPEPAVVEQEPVPEPDPEPDPAVVLEEARQRAWAEGLAAGQKQGYAEGRKEGYQRGMEAGRAEGLEAGHAEGLAQGRQQAAEEARRLNELASACAASLLALEESVGQGLLTLALDVARQVVRTTLAEQPDAVLAAVREVLHTDISGDGPLQLWVHPDDLQLVQLHLQDELGQANWRILADDTLLRGGCRAETAFGSIDATLQTRWRRVAASLGRASEWEPAP